MTQAQNPNLIRPLEGLRALAIIVVLLFHLDVPYFTGGYIGVDLFFVISGYIITKNIAEKSYANKFSIAEFYVKRIRRLFPALFLTILATLIAGYFFLTPYDYEELTKSGLFSTFSLANIHFWQSAGYFDTASHMKPLLHMWSLSVEEQFYIIWPTLLLGLIALAKKWNNAITIGIATIFLISALGAVIVSMSSPPTAFFWFVFRIYQFMAGAFLVFIPNSKDQSTSSSHPKIPLMPLLSILGLISLIGASIFFDKNSNTAFVGISSTIIGVLLITSMRSKFAEIIFGNPIFVWVGQHSYSLYLVHWPIIVYYKYVTGSKLSYYDMILLAGASIICAMLLRFFIEQPFRIKRTSLRSARSYYTIATAGLFTATVALSSHILYQKGFPNRFDETLSKLLNERYDAKRHSVENRVGDCFLGRENKINDLKPFCYEGGAQEKSLLIIGSSLAADFYPGIAKGLPNWNTYQVTASGCPPYLNLDGADTCAELRRFIFKNLLDNNEFDLVLLGGIHSNASNSAISEIVNFMEKRAINYAILGPRPSFEERPTVLIRNHGKTEGLEAYMQSKLASSPEINFQFTETNYFSSNEALCDSNNNCRWYGNDKLFYKDAVHFSVDGSYFIGDKLSKWIKENYED